VSNSFVAFYDEQGIVPVRQIDVGTNQHIARRRRLYQTLGVPLEMIHNKNVLEVGAGTGDNATVNLMFKPKMYTFLDSSEEVLEFLNTRKSLLRKVI
jgi:ubiquinone/menaquinone biosynthesis C-methylase UbiE